MKLTENPEMVIWPATHYVFVEKEGPFLETAQCAWKEVHQSVSELEKFCQRTGGISLFKVMPVSRYRAGFIVNTRPEKLPNGCRYENFLGGKYAKFTLHGSYSQLPEACGRVMDISEASLKIRDDFFIEHYVNDPFKTVEAELITEILVPIK